MRGDLVARMDGYFGFGLRCMVRRWWLREKQLSGHVTIWSATVQQRPQLQLDPVEPQCLSYPGHLELLRGALSLGKRGLSGRGHWLPRTLPQCKWPLMLPPDYRPWSTVAVTGVNLAFVWMAPVDPGSRVTADRCTHILAPRI